MEGRQAQRVAWTALAAGLGITMAVWVTVATFELVRGLMLVALVLGLALEFLGVMALIVLWVLTQKQKMKQRRVPQYLRPGPQFRWSERR